MRALSREGAFPRLDCISFLALRDKRHEGSRRWEEFEGSHPRELEADDGKTGNCFSPREPELTVEKLGELHQPASAPEPFGELQPSISRQAISLQPK